MSKRIYLSVVVPCYNEERRFKDGFPHYFSYLKKQNYPWELIFVNDGSADRTLSLIERASQKSPSIKCLTYARNRGKGYAIVQGVRQARGRYVLFTDLDHAVSIDTIEGFFKYFNAGFKVVIGSRRVPGAKFLKRQKLLRETLGRGFTLLVRLIIDWKIKDATCGFKAFENKSAKKLFLKISIYDWAFDAELLFLCKKYNIDYSQAPVAWRDVAGSKVSPVKDVFKSLFGLLKIRVNDLQGQYS